MKLRLHGTPAECAAAALGRTPGLHLWEQSVPYADRAGELAWVYLAVDLDPAAASDPAAAVGCCPARGGVPNLGVL
jgi:hypothetical protein